MVRPGMCSPTLNPLVHVVPALLIAMMMIMMPYMGLPGLQKAAGGPSWAVPQPLSL